MEARQRIIEILNEGIADIFMKDKDFIAANHDMKFRTSLKATSMQYFPLITIIEEKLDIELDAHDFQYKAHTIGEAVDYILNAYTAQKGN